MRAAGYAVRVAPRAWIALLVAGAVFGVYWQVRTHDFVDFDDFVYIVDNPHLQDGLSAAGIAHDFGSIYHLNWHPLTSVSYRIDYELYGLDATARSLPGYVDWNFLLESRSGERHVLKISDPSEPREALEFQNQAMERLSTKADAPMSPRVCPTPSGDLIATLPATGAGHFVRLESLEPRPLCQIADFIRDVRNGFTIGIPQNRNQEPPLGINRQTNVDIMLKDNLNETI